MPFVQWSIRAGLHNPIESCQRPPRFTSQKWIELAVLYIQKYVPRYRIREASQTLYCLALGSEESVPDKIFQPLFNAGISRPVVDERIDGS